MFKASNNEAEYEVLIAGIELYYMPEGDSVKTYSNSQLIISQLNRDYEVRIT